MTPVLIGFAEALSAVEVSWSLTDAGFKVIAFARKGRNSPLRHSRFAEVHEVTSPEHDFSASLQEVTSIIEKRFANSRPGILLPLDDSAVLLCDQLNGSSAFALAGPRGKSAELALNKTLQLAIARQSGFSVPDTAEIYSRSDLSSYRGVFPIMLKPADAALRNGNRISKGKNWICANRSELEAASEQWNGQYRLLLQPLIAGGGEGIFGIATSSGVEALTAHRRLRMMNPHGSGSSACVSQPVPSALIAKVAEFIKRSGWTGLFMIELLRDRAQNLWFIEFNGRPWGSMALSRRQGFEYPAWHASLSLDPQWHLNGGTPAPRTIVCRNLGREIMHLLFVIRGRKSAALTDWPSIWATLRGVLLVNPRDSYYNFRRDDLRVFLSDCFCTIRDQAFKPRAAR